jgi:hypothetical protein
MKFYFVVLKLVIGEIEEDIKSSDTRIWSFWIIKSNIPKLYCWMSIRFSFYNSFETSNIHDVNKYQRAFKSLCKLSTGYFGVSVAASVPMYISRVTSYYYFALIMVKFLQFQFYFSRFDLWNIPAWDMES